MQKYPININQKIDYTNLFEALKTYEDNYNQCEENETEDKHTVRTE